MLLLLCRDEYLWLRSDLCFQFSSRLGEDFLICSLRDVGNAPLSSRLLGDSLRFDRSGDFLLSERLGDSLLFDLSGESLLPRCSGERLEDSLRFSLSDESLPESLLPLRCCTGEQLDDFLLFGLSGESFLPLRCFSGELLPLRYCSGESRLLEWGDSFLCERSSGESLLFKRSGDSLRRERSFDPCLFQRSIGSLSSSRDRPTLESSLRLCESFLSERSSRLFLSLSRSLLFICSFLLLRFLSEINYQQSIWDIFLYVNTLFSSSYIKFQSSEKKHIHIIVIDYFNP